MNHDPLHLLPMPDYSIILNDRYVLNPSPHEGAMRLEHELHHVANRRVNVPRGPLRRLHGWLRDQRLAAYLA